MGKTKTSRKQKPFSPKNMEVVTLKAGVKTKPYDPQKQLADPTFMASALLESLLDGDMEEFKDTLRAHYEAINITKALRHAGLSKRTFYSALSEDGNPSLSTVMKIVAGLKKGA